MKILRRFIYLFFFLILISLLAYFAFFRTNIISLSTIIGDDNKKFILKYTTVSGVEGFDGSLKKAEGSVVKSID